MTSLGAPVTVSELAPSSASMTTEEWQIAMLLNPKLQSTANTQQDTLDAAQSAAFAHNLASGRQTLPGEPDAPARWAMFGETEPLDETSGSGNPRGGFAFGPILAALAGPLINGAIGAISKIGSRRTGGSGSRPPNARTGPYGRGILAPELERKIIERIGNSEEELSLADPHDLWCAIIDTAEDVIADYIKANRDDVSGGARFIAQQAMRKTIPRGFVDYIRGPRGQRKPNRRIGAPAATRDPATDPSFVVGVPAPSAAQMAIPLMKYGARKILGPNSSRIHDDLYSREAQLADVSGSGKFKLAIKRVFPKIIKFARNGLARILSDPSVKAAAIDTTPKLLNAAFGKFNVNQDGGMANIARSVAQKAVSGAMDAGASAAKGSGKRKPRGGAPISVAPGGSLDPRTHGQGSRAPNGQGSRAPNGGARKSKAARVNFRVKVL